MNAFESPVRPQDTAGLISVEAYKASRNPVELARHTPGLVYASPAVFQLEKQRLFMKDWLFVGHVDELRNPGDYITHSIMGEPIVVTRDQAGELNAFYNQCAHRGVEVAEGSGNTKRFKCPYHAWTYDLQGKLIGAPFMRDIPDFDISHCRLKPVKIGVWAGWIFISFNRDVEPLDSFMAFFQQEFGFLHPERCRLAYKYEIEFQCNWKFVYENLLDIYHVGTTHAKTIGQFHDEKSYRFNRQPGGQLSIAYETRTMTQDGQSRFGKMPWLENETERLGRIGFLPPNLTFLARCDYVRPFAHWPLSPNRTKSVAYFLFPEGVKEDPNFTAKMKDYTDFLTQVLDEDTGMILSLQRAMETRGFQPGRMSKMEQAIHHVVGNHLERVFGPDLAA